MKPHPNPRAILENSTLLVSREEVKDALDRMAIHINEYYGDTPLVMLIVMTGAVLPAAWLSSRLTMPMEMDFVHASRYSGATEGGEIDFRVPPRLNLQGQDVLIVDDIYDIGLTLETIENYCRSREANSVNSAVLVRKIHDRPTTERRPRFIGLEVEDKYIFGCGMDAYEHWRHLDEIRALEED